MNRLTKRNEDNYDLYLKLPTIEKQAFLDKLGQLENIEEELGIDLITLFTALKDGFYYKDDDYGIIKNRCTVGIDAQFIFEEGTNLILEIKDYKKTWALDKNELTKEELENE